ncbi:MAG: alcohol dehydrogenase catalytic domain-containing protein [Deltaproteobacteria bacterium]|nr:alcohol dehydrogenase catalytic domain-containing protein [Deltaproteobacteria bacterium]
MKHRVVYLLGPERIEVREEPVPAPDEGELLVRIRAATTCGTDVKVFRRGGHPRMLRAPTPFGHEFAGSVEALGAGVSGYETGDRVVVANSAPCGRCAYCEAGRENLCRHLEYINGAYAEYIRISRRFVEVSTYRLDPALPYEIAALVEPLACVIHGVDASRLDDGADVLVHGAGPIGLLLTAVLAVRGHGVVAADPNPHRLDVARTLGARDTVAVARGGGAADLLRARSRHGDGFDCAIDATGIPEVWQDAVACVRPGGVVNLFGGCAPGTTIPLDTASVHYNELTVMGSYHHRPATVAQALEMLSRKTLDPRPLLSAEVPLQDLEKALRSMMAREALKVVVRP